MWFPDIIVSKDYASLGEEIRMFSSNEIYIALLSILWFYSFIRLSARKDHNYINSVNINNRFSIIFFFQDKNNTVPFITYLTAIQFYTTVPLLLFFKLINASYDFAVMLALFLFIPWGFVIVPIDLMLRFRQYLSNNKGERLKKEMLKEQRKLIRKQKKKKR